MSLFFDEVDRQRKCLSVRRLSTGYWHLRGDGPLNWSQPSTWPCLEQELRDAACPGACDEFIQACFGMEERKE